MENTAYGGWRIGPVTFGSRVEEIIPGRAPRSHSPLLNPGPPQNSVMSSTLFGRGVMSQVGERQRAEATDKAITTLRAEVTEVRGLSTLVRALEARLQAAERKTAVLEAELEKVKTAAAAASSGGDVAARAAPTAATST